MDSIFERWCECRRGARALCWGMVCLVVTALAWGTVLKPLNRQLAERQGQLRQVLHGNAALWPVALRVAQGTAPEARGAQPFSPLAFQGNGTTLVRWKPLPAGGELTLDADWPRIPDIFDRLAQQSAGVSAFVIAPHAGRLRIAIQLELYHGT